MRDFFEITVMKRLQGRRSSYITEVIEAKTREVIASATYVTDELFAFDTEIEADRARKSVRRDMGDAAIQALRYLESSGELSLDQKMTLMLLLGTRAVEAVSPLSPTSATNDSQEDLFAS